MRHRSRFPIRRHFPAALVCCPWTSVSVVMSDGFRRNFRFRLDRAPPATTTRSINADGPVYSCPPRRHSRILTRQAEKSLKAGLDPGGHYVSQECTIALSVTSLFGTWFSTLTNRVVGAGFPGPTFMGRWLERLSGLREGSLAWR